MLWLINYLCICLKRKNDYKYYSCLPLRLHNYGLCQYVPYSDYLATYVWLIMQHFERKKHCKKRVLVYLIIPGSYCRKCGSFMCEDYTNIFLSDPNQSRQKTACQQVYCLESLLILCICAPCEVCTVYLKIVKETYPGYFTWKP